MLLYEELGKVSPEQQQSFYRAHMTGDEETNASYRGQYFAQTLSALNAHVDYVLNELEELGVRQMTKQDTESHPRLPLIMNHNQFVKNTSELVKQNLDNVIS